MSDDRLAFPDRLDARHVQPRGGLHRHASVLSLAALGGLMLAAAAGAFGGYSPETLSARGDGVELSVVYPSVIRNGEFFEATFEVVATGDIADCVLAIAPSLMRRQTMNAMIPAASEESYADDLFRFSYGPLKAGEVLMVKADFQINPDLYFGTEGTVAVLDGPRPLAEIELAMKVWP